MTTITSSLEQAMMKTMMMLQTRKMTRRIMALIETVLFKLKRLGSRFNKVMMKMTMRMKRMAMAMRMTTKTTTTTTTTMMVLMSHNQARKSKLKRLDK